MADLSRLKARRSFPSPPPPHESTDNLKAPESAPTAPEDGVVRAETANVEAPTPDQTPSATDATVSNFAAVSTSTALNHPESSLPAALPASVSAVADHSMSDVDGRSLRKTGRNTAFATRLKEATVSDIKRLAQSQGCTMAEIIERAVELLKSQTTS